MNEKEFLQRLKTDAENIEIPASLHPDAIEQKLKQMQDTADHKVTFADFDHTNTKPAKKRNRMRRNIIRYGSLAAVFALTVTAAYRSDILAPGQENPDHMRITKEADLSSLPGSTPDSLETVYQALYDAFYYTEEDFYPGLGARLFGGAEIMYEMSVEDSAVTEESLMNSSPANTLDTGSNDSSISDSVDFSGTNLQEFGVDEADIVKTDGTYLYILRDNLSLAIVEANDGNPKLLSLISFPEKISGAAHEMYLDQDQLHVILTETVTKLNQEGDIYDTRTTRQTSLLTYNISDRSKPVLSGQITQEGSYSDSRKNGSYIYLFSRYIPDIRENFEDSTIAPLINGTPADAENFYLPETLTDNAYLVISSVDVSNPDEVLDNKILVSSASDFYVSQNNIYIMNENYSGEHLNTELTKFHYENGQITGIGAASVKGDLNNSFSLNEHNDYLRVVSTYENENREEQNGLFIFDEALNQISSIENLAEGETIRSARFLGDTGYFVTFRQTDPLFSVDLTDPENPKILGELKISGFSSYLHFYGENQLLGIGYEADESTGTTTGIKLSMFDISDPADVKETSRHIIENITWCPAIEDYKAILVQPEKNVIGFYCDNRYLVFSYDPETGFTQELVYDFFSDGLTGQADYYNMRGLYIEDMLYLTGNSFVVTFDMDDDFEKETLLNIYK